MASSKVQLILPLVDAQRNRRAGKKAINLSKLIAAHFAVPRGFVISADAYRSHLWASGARDIASDAADAEDREKIRTAILSSDIPQDIWEAILEAYQRLSLQLGFENPLVAVRSSAMEEGPAETSFPGAYESILNVAGQDALEAAIKRVWASLWGGKAAAYRMRYGITAEPAMAVIVQQMMDTQWSGTALTADPVTGNRNRVVVSCSSSANPSDFACYVVDLHNPSTVTSGDDLSKSPGEEVITLLAEKAIVVERTLGSSVEVEWTYDRDRLWVVQARPMTNVPAYFPTDQDAAPDLDAQWRKLTSAPVSFFARGSLCESERVRIVNGYAYGRAGIAEATPVGKEMSEGFRLLEEWETRMGQTLKARAADNIQFERASAERDDLIVRARAAIEDVKLSGEWVAKARYFGPVFCRELQQMLPDASDDPSACHLLFGGLPGGAIMRDARLQELADQFCIAEKSGKIDDHDWRKNYKSEVECFARDYGYSFRNLGDTFDPAPWESWIENTDTVFRMIAAIRNRDSRPSLITLHCAAEDNFRQAASELEQSIGSRKRGRLEKMLRLSRGWLSLGNECEMILALASAGLRLIVAELGHRLRKARAITDTQDAFHLSMSEIAEAGPDLNESQRNEIAALVAQRKHEMWLEQRLTPPNHVPTKSGETTLLGTSISPGTVSGRARIVQSIEEAGEIKSGEILVVESASLAWTPFLAVAGGFIAQGECLQPGVESIIRTYGVPAIIGCKGAVGILQSGRRITLDGSSATVETIFQPSPARSV
ncbi:MAG: PEP/pyruvate-binding domain-containing protein [Armatimonadota bacterium]